MVQKVDLVMIRSAPEPDLCILRANGSNLSSWLENMHRHMQKEYGVIGQYIETKVLVQREIPTPNHTLRYHITLNECKIEYRCILYERLGAILIIYLNS